MDEYWTIPEMLPPLEDETVQVWRIDFARLGDSLNDLLDAAYDVLNFEERARAARMRAGSSRDEFVAGRGCLRRLLGAAAGRDAGSLVFDIGAHGRPDLRGAGQPGFNVTHSRGMVLIALSRAAVVGIDVEYLDTSVECTDVARTTFHPDDVARMEQAITDPERLKQFYRCWTRREAVGKADGRGLLTPLHATLFDEDGLNEFKINISSDGTEKQRRFFVRQIDVGSAYSAAVASARAGLELQLLEASYGMIEAGYEMGCLVP